MRKLFDKVHSKAQFVWSTVIEKINSYKSRFGIFIIKLEHLCNNTTLVSPCSNIIKGMATGWLAGWLVELHIMSINRN